MANTFIVSVSPHLRAHENTARVMRAVSISLVPAALASIYIFGWRALAVIAVSVVVSVLTELLSQLVFKRDITVRDGSAVVTGILLAFTLPVQTPLWMVAAGAFVAIFLVKQLFGGIGHNIFNPALAARAVLLSSFPVAMTAWSTPALSLGRVDATAAASALGMVKEAAKAGTAVRDALRVPRPAPGKRARLTRGGVQGRAPAGRRLPAHPQDHRLAHPRDLHGQRGAAVVHRGHGPAVRRALGRPHPGRLLHGHRLRHRADDSQRPARSSAWAAAS